MSARDAPDVAEHRLLTYCPACHARAGIERSQLQLIAASLALAPVCGRYQRGHGLFVHHPMQVTDG